MEEGEAEEEGEEEEEEEEYPLPTYSEAVGSEEEAVEELDVFAKTTLTAEPPSPPRKRAVEFHQSLRDKTGDRSRIDRTRLIFDALVDQQNNNAHWLGANSKLTRLKLYGGLSTLLKLNVDWPQFDAVWTKLGGCDLDYEDFKRHFDLDAPNASLNALDGDLASESQRGSRRERCSRGSTATPLARSPSPSSAQC
jgi:hypothetical protein